MCTFEAGAKSRALGKSLVGHGHLSLDPIKLDGTPLMAEISRAIEVPLRDRAGSIQTNFVIRDARITTDRLQPHPRQGSDGRLRLDRL